MDLYVWDTELTVMLSGACYLHGKTKERRRIVDGQKHPVKIIRKGRLVKR